MNISSILIFYFSYIQELPTTTTTTVSDIRITKVHVKLNLSLILLIIIFFWKLGFIYRDTTNNHKSCKCFKEEVERILKEEEEKIVYIKNSLITISERILNYDDNKESRSDNNGKKYNNITYCLLI